MGKPTIYIGENKDADQLRGNREADQRLCFRYTGSTIPLLSKYKISSLERSSVTVQVGLCRTCSETTLLVFPRGGSNEVQNIHNKDSSDIRLSGNLFDDKIILHYENMPMQYTEIFFYCKN